MYYRPSQDFYNVTFVLLRFRISFFCLQVTILQVTQNPGQPKNFTFAVDGSLQNLTLYITGFSSLTFSLTNPAGDVADFVLGHLGCRRSNTFPPCQVLLRAPVRQMVLWRPSPRLGIYAAWKSALITWPDLGQSASTPLTHILLKSQVSESWHSQPTQMWIDVNIMETFSRYTSHSVFFSPYWVFTTKQRLIDWNNQCRRHARWISCICVCLFGALVRSKFSGCHL